MAWAMYLIGHTDPTLTMRVYQQVSDMGGTAPDQLEELLGCTVDEAFTLLSGREVWTPKGHSAGKRPVAAAWNRGHRRRNPLWERASCQAAEGIRTLDLLHGKQEGPCPAGQLHPCKSSTFRSCPPAAVCPSFTDESLEFVDRMWTRSARPSAEAAVGHGAPRCRAAQAYLPSGGAAELLPSREVRRRASRVPPLMGKLGHSSSGCQSWSSRASSRVS
jgi:hypothetical protein